MTREVIVFPDVEDLLVDYLSAELDARGEQATVHTTTPATRPDTFVLVPRSGGTRANLVTDNATIAVEAWAGTDAAASDLAQLVRGLIHALPGRTVNGTPFYRTAEFGGPVNLPDPASEQPRYTLTVAVSCRGAAV